MPLGIGYPPENPLAPAEAAGAAPIPPPNGAAGASLAPDSMGAALGGLPMPEEGMEGMPPGFQPAQGAGPMFPTADPDFMGQLLGELVGAQMEDHQSLSSMQQSALVENPIFEALVAGAPLGPGAGQDGAALAQDAGVLPGA